jgi:hypothetical protein
MQDHFQTNEQILINLGHFVRLCSCLISYIIVKFELNTFSIIDFVIKSQ